MRLAVIACFLNEESYLPTFLESVACQTRQPDRLLLVDDGSVDGSLRLAQEFAVSRADVLALSRPQRPPQRDRLATAAELEAFCWAIEQLDLPWQVVAKLDADMSLSPDLFAELELRLEADPRLGIAGAIQSLRLPDGRLVRERCPANHVRGSTKFYRRECFEEISPLAFRLGWDTTDEVRARMSGWGTQSFSMPSGDPIHLRPTSTADGALRGYRRNGTAAYAYGASFWWVSLGAVGRLGDRPRVLGGLSLLQGWLTARLRGYPRADARQRAFLAGEHRSRAREALRRLVRRLDAAS
ncbi:MAG TPA: glycosyltransferase family A protein [Solirubrobacteraceae bacterium]|jgi:glycosyltransferase involved in cell wall biosynthesis